MAQAVHGVIVGLVLTPSHIVIPDKIIACLDPIAWTKSATESGMGIVNARINDCDNNIFTKVTSLVHGSHISVVVNTPSRVFQSRITIGNNSRPFNRQVEECCRPNLGNLWKSFNLGKGVIGSVLFIERNTSKDLRVKDE
jgi:hypothetical protein